MKFFLTFLMIIFHVQILFGQNDSLIYYESNTGNYVIEYQGDTSMIKVIFEPSTKVDPKINCIIEQNDSLFSYKYIITNRINSKQRLEDFDLEIKADIIETSSPDLYWKYSIYSFVSVAGWYNSKGEGGLSHPYNGISPDSSISGFKLVSHGLPSIVKAFFKGKPDDKNFIFPEEPPNDIEQALDTLIKFPKNTVQRFTVGPKTPHSLILLGGFADTIISYTNKSYELNWINNQAIADKYLNLLTSAKSQLQQNNISAARNSLQTVLTEVDKDSISNLTSEAYALLRYNTEYLLKKLPEAEPGLNIRLINSTGVLLTTGSLQYYEGSWKDAVNNGDGTFKVITELPAVSLRMTYEYGSQTISNVPAQNNTYTFQTLNTQVQLKNSQGSLIDQGTVQYYAGAWREFGTTTSGIAAKELLPNTYSFRMTYAYGSNDKQQNIGINPTVVFETVNAAVQLQNSQGTLIDQGTVQYYAGAWRTFGTTSNGVTTKELLPNNYSFRMTYEFVSNDKQQNIGTNPAVVFPTILTTIRVLNAQGQPVDNASIKYYAGAWRTIGSTVNGVVTKELLPANITFRVNSGTVQQDKTQNTSSNPVVEFNLP